MLGTQPTDFPGMTPLFRLLLGTSYILAISLFPGALKTEALIWQWGWGHGAVEVKLCAPCMIHSDS